MFQWRPAPDERIEETANAREPAVDKERVFVPCIRFNAKAKDKPEASQKGQTGKSKYISVDWAHRTTNRQSWIPLMEQQGKGYTPEEASLFETDANGS